MPQHLAATLALLKPLALRRALHKPHVQHQHLVQILKSTQAHSHQKKPSKSMQKTTSIFSILLLLFIKSSAYATEIEEPKCTLWKTISEQLDSQKSKFTLAARSGEEDLIFARKNNNKFYFKNDEKIEILSFNEASKGMKLYGLIFHFPLENSDCLKIGSSLVRKTNEFELTIRHPAKNYFFSTIKLGTKNFSEAILLIED
ncbi:hypothetical protein [Acidovorax sp. LjRoot194]|uniref:hypothetical protein n=1 Tax=Acidovorax sp. LjRoot194 TaxID=3342280 RepID=UPI003ECDE41D